uniref:Putative histone-lysine n-methyltransferase smyd3 n=1 Tax=Culex tarsalis TaxID=7177 RepID=A0A1Q3F045_CULTA
MIRPEVVQQLSCPSFGLATSWIISRKAIPAVSLGEALSCLKREVWPFPKTLPRKDPTVAKVKRELANETYRKTPSELGKILALYNEAICWAPEGSEELAMGYGNRSAIFFNGKQYRRCLANIELAKASNYPEGKRDKLLEREKKCLNLLEKEPKMNEEEGNLFLEVTETSHSGRGLTAKKDFVVGEIILHEKPSHVVIEPEVTFTRCGHCGHRNEYDLIPCKTCTAAMYCSETCRAEAFTKYHRFECEIVEDLKNLFKGPKTTRMFQLTLRLFWMVVSDLIDDRDLFLKRYADLSAYRNPLEVDPTKLHLHVLADKLPDLSADQTGKGVTQFITALTYKLALEENNSVPKDLVKDNKDLLLEVLFRLVVQARLVCDQSPEDISCLYPLFRMVNHSCAPNAERVLNGERSMLVAKRPIRSGEQVLVCYFPNGTSDSVPKDKRRAQLQREFQFDCQCLSCSLDYPLLASIEDNAELRTELEAIKSEVNSSTRLRLLADFLQRHDDKYPRKELAEAWRLFREVKI